MIGSDSSRASAGCRRLVLLSTALYVAAGCVHTHRVAEEEQGNRTGGARQEEGSSGRASKSRVPPREGRPAVAASPEGLMNPGSAREIQEALRGKGYLEAVSGELDQATSAALRRFQHDQQLAETGAPDRETLRRLGVDPQSVYRTVPRGQEAEPGR